MLLSTTFQISLTGGKPMVKIETRVRGVVEMEKREEETRTRKRKKRLTLREAKPKAKAEVKAVNDVVCEDIEDFSKGEIHKIRDSLLEWYYGNQKVLPWRTNQRDEEDDGVDVVDETRAYAVWVSEVMLQQTRVATVIEYYKRWMEKWPTLYHLAQASQEEVNHIWAGLGYYRRARFLLEGAKMLVQSGPPFPSTVSSLRKVPGIGDYTAGAIASIAFKQPVPAVDGNVIRVISRLKAISANPKDKIVIKSFWKLAGQLVDPSRPGDFNQALMELGATICSPSSPGCSICPVSGQCCAFSLSKCCQSVQVTDYPKKVIKAKPRLDFCAVCVVEILEDQRDTHAASDRNNGFLLIKRPDEGLLAGLWEFPSVALDGEADLTVRRKAMDQYLKKSFKIDTTNKYTVLLREDVGECVHIFTHIRLRMYVELLVLRLKGGAKIFPGKVHKDSLTCKVVDIQSMQSIGLTSGVRKVYNMIQQFKQKRLSTSPCSRN